MRIVILAACLGLSTVATSRASGAEPPAAARVLILYQHSFDMPFRAAFDPVLKQALRLAAGSRLEIYTESLETDRFPEREHSELVERYLQEKYRDRPPGLVIAVYDTALQFVRAHRDAVFPGVPVLAITTRRLVPGPGEDLTGIWTGSNVQDTVTLALQLQPETRQVFVVDGALRNSGATQDESQSLLTLEPRVSVTYLRDRSLAEIKATLAGAPPESIVVYVRQLIGTEGEPIDQVHGLREIRAASSLPVFGTAEALVGSGLLGGYVSSIQGNATRLASLAGRILGGTSAGALLPATGVLVPVFDARELRRRAIDEEQLPPGSQVLFRQPTLWGSHRRSVVAAAAVVAAQALMIGALLVQRRRRRTAERTLQRSEARNHATLRALPDLLLVIGRNGVLLECHAWNRDVLPTPPAQCLGKRIADIMPPDVAASFMRELEIAVQNEEPRVIEYALAGAASRQFEARLVACDTDTVLTIVRDVTEDRRAHAEVLLSRQRYALATGACGVGVWDWNLQTSEFYIDPAFMRILGYDDPPPDRFEGLLQYIHEEDRAASRAEAEACASGRAETYLQEHRIIACDGSVRWFQCRGSVIASESGAASRVVGTFWDVTDRKDAEASLRSSEMALRARHREIQDLVGRLIAAQEIERSWLARELHDDLSQKLALLAIDVGRVGLLRTLPDDAAEHIHAISQRADEIATVVHDLSHQLHPTTLEVLGLVSAIQSVCRDFGSQHHVGVKFTHRNVPADLSKDVALCLFRIVQESLRNVVRHSGAASALVDISASEHELLLEIADHGKGFAADTSRTGLGLLSMRERVHFVGGEIVVSSTPGQGTRIRVRVPHRVVAGIASARRQALA